MTTVPPWRAGRDPLPDGTYDMGQDLPGHPYLDLRQMIWMRLRILHDHQNPFECLIAHRSGDIVHVFLVVNGQPITLSDGFEMFPSDDLITKLNLLRK